MINPDHISRELRNQFFGLKYFNYLIRIWDPGWKKFGSGIWDPGWKTFGSRIRNFASGEPVPLNNVSLHRERERESSPPSLNHSWAFVSVPLWEQEDKNSAKQLEQTFFSSSNNELYIVVRTASAWVLKLEKWKPHSSLFNLIKPISVRGLAKKGGCSFKMGFFLQSLSAFLYVSRSVLMPQDLLYIV